LPVDPGVKHYHFFAVHRKPVSKLKKPYTSKKAF